MPEYRIEEDKKMKLAFLREDVYSNITINLLDDCNLYCAYCFRDAAPKKEIKLNFVDVKRVLDFFSYKNRGKKTIIQLTGGEIFLHQDIFRIIKYALSLGFLVRLQTNGMFFRNFTCDELKLLSNDNVVIKISIDGWNEETHDLYRGRGTFSKVLGGIELVRSITPRVGLKTVIHKKNFPELHKMLELCLHYEVRSWSHNVLRNSGRCNFDNKITELDVVRKLIQYYNQPRYKYLLGGSNVLVYYLMVVKERKTLPLYFFINSDGDIYLTDDIKQQNKVGSIYGTELDNEFDLERVSNLPKRKISEEALVYVKNNLKF